MAVDEPIARTAAREQHKIIVDAGAVAQPRELALIDVPDFIDRVRCLPRQRLAPARAFGCNPSVTRRWNCDDLTTASSRFNSCARDLNDFSAMTEMAQVRSERG